MFISGGGTGLTAFCQDGHPERTRIKIGSDTMFGKHNHITASNSIVIGKGVRTGSYVLITDNSHGDTSDKEQMKMNPNDRPIYSKGAVVIGDFVWIGEKAAIMPNVTIGYGAVVGANAVVTKDVPPYTIVAGCPARVIGKAE